MQGRDAEIDSSRDPRSEPGELRYKSCDPHSLGTSSLRSQPQPYLNLRTCSYSPLEILSSGPPITGRNLKMAFIATRKRFETFDHIQPGFVRSGSHQSTFRTL